MAIHCTALERVSCCHGCANRAGALRVCEGVQDIDVPLRIEGSGGSASSGGSSQKQLAESHCFQSFS
jgi:hypothetical protein